MHKLGKIVDYNKKVENLAVNSVQKELLKQDIYIENLREIPDTGIDALGILYSRNSVNEDRRYDVYFQPNRNFHLQFKGMDPKNRDDHFYKDKSPKRTIEVIHLQTWMQEGLPVILTLTDLKEHDSPTTYWMHIQEELDDSTKKKICKKREGDIQFNERRNPEKDKKKSKHDIKFKKNQTIEKLRNYLCGIFEKVDSKVDSKINLNLDPKTFDKYARLPHFKEIQEKRQLIQKEFENISLYKILKIDKRKLHKSTKGEKFGIRTNIPKVDLAPMPWRSSTFSGNNIVPISRDIFSYFEVYEYDSLISRANSIIDLDKKKEKIESVFGNMKSPVVLLPSFEIVKFLIYFGVNREDFSPPLTEDNLDYHARVMYIGEYNKCNFKLVNFFPSKYPNVKSTLFKKLNKLKDRKTVYKFHFIILDTQELEFKIQLPRDNDPLSSTDVTVEFYARIKPTEVSHNGDIKINYDYFDMLLFLEAQILGDTNDIFYYITKKNNQ